MTYAPGGMAADQALVSRRLFTVAEYHRMGEVGIFQEDDRIELIEGEIVQMPAVGSPHVSAVMLLTQLLSQAVGKQAMVSVQNPIRLGDGSEPQPDLALPKPRVDRYRPAIPHADDVLLVIEVSDTTLRYDREVKRPLYARYSIPEMWIVDVTASKVEVCRGPKPDGYASVESVGRDDVLTIAALPGVTIAVRDFLD